MNSHKEDVLHKLEFKKIIKNSPKSNIEEFLNPPSFSESFFLANSFVSDNNLKETKQQKINQLILENCEKWLETIESASSSAYFKKKQLRNNLSTFSVFISRLFFIKYLIDFLNILLNIFFGLQIPFVYLIEDYENIKHQLYFLLFCHLINIIIQNFYSKIIRTRKIDQKQKFNFLNESTLKNLSIIFLILIYTIVNISLLLLMISFYYFYMGYKKIEIFVLLLIIQKRKFYKLLAILKAFIYYCYLLHLFSCFFENTSCDGDFLKKYQESLIININFLTFQSNYYFQDSQLSFEIILNKIIALILMFYTIDILIKIRSIDGEIEKQIKFDVYVLQYYMWHHKGQILKKIQYYSQISNKELKYEQLGQKEIIRKIYQQILKDNLGVLKIFSKQFMINLSQKVKSIRKQKNQFREDKHGLYLILEGKGNLSFESNFKVYKEINTKEYTFGLINCFYKNISEVQLEMDNNFLLLYINSEDFYSCLTLSKDFELFHLIKNKIIFEGDTSMIDYRCWICNGQHQERRCQILKIEINIEIINEQNMRSNFKNRFNKKRYYAYRTYLLHKQNESHTIDQSESSSSDSEEQFERYADEGSGSQRVSDKNYIVQSSKGNIQIPAIQKDVLTDHIPDKLYEQLKSSHRNIQLQPSINTCSQQQGEMLRSDFRSIPLYPSQYKFQELLSVDDLDSVKEYVYYYPEFNISNIISILNN
ncbi:unnamed protein product [Paramecium sonneborni]|uniref:Uncharacterized protein n=1 Tax=Paramecium sonneborni TaxID=65129 RepID=A0A8S1QQ85_9CILI|nr:unnamed protein product [Paramecium sonneborni]